MLNLLLISKAQAITKDGQNLLHQLVSDTSIHPRENVEPLHLRSHVVIQLRNGIRLGCPSQCFRGRRIALTMTSIQPTVLSML
jgi:hypothetical protein